MRIHVEMMKRILSEVIRENRGMLVALAVVTVLLLALGWFILRPAYLDSGSRFYTSNLGYPSVLRQMGKPLPVVAAKARPREFRRAVMGEGTCASEPVLVPAVPMARITKVTVEEGEVVTPGQVLAELDPSKAKIKWESAKLAVSTAEAELERVKAGSAYVLAQERPEVEKINLAAEEERAALAREKVERYRSAEKRGVVSRAALLAVEEEFNEAERRLAQTRLAKQMAEAGVAQSLRIAENGVRDAKEALAHREAELRDYVVRAPAAGVIERVLVREGEYNQDSGKPAFLIASGLWFEACFDQSDFELVETGQGAEVRLEAYPGSVFPGEVGRIVPVVSFNQGGPEISRPLRPRGSGSPEWAATFKGRIKIGELAGSGKVATGMTGFARLEVRREGIAVPRAALVSVSAGSGLVYVPGAEGNWEGRKVRVGLVDAHAAEILEGIRDGEEVLVEGHWILESGDRIEVREVRDGTF